MITIVQRESLVKIKQREFLENPCDETKGQLYMALMSLIENLININYPEIVNDEDINEIAHELAYRLCNRLQDGFIVYAWTKYLRYAIRDYVYHIFRAKSLSSDVASIDFPSNKYRPDDALYHRDILDKLIKKLVSQIKKEFPLPDGTSSLVVYMIMLSILYNIDLIHINPRYLGSRIKFYRDKLAEESLGLFEKNIKLLRSSS